MLKFAKTKRAIAMTAATLAIAGAATITATGTASAASGGGCRAWFSLAPYGHNVQVEPCISASGNHIYGSAYLLGGDPVGGVTVNLVNKNTNQPIWQWGYACPQGPAGNCEVADNIDFGPYPAGTYYVQVYLDINGTWYGPIDSPVLYT